MILEEVVKQASNQLKKVNINSYQLDAELILSDIMGVSRESLITNDKISISQIIINKYNRAIKRRINGEPVAYILGKKEFWSNDFFVNQKTLIPRPETELLIYKVIDYFKNKRINILDVGTGSGCILLSIIKELNGSRGTGIDISAQAVKIARVNCKKMNLIHRVKFKVSNINKFNLEKYDLVVSNPPYIPVRKIRHLSKDIVNYEPLSALNGGQDGLDIIKRVIYKSAYLLKMNGLIALEIGDNQYKKVSRILRQKGFREISKEYDYNRNVRCIISTKIRFL